MKIKIGCAFRKPVNFKNGYSVDCFYPLGDNPTVQINDIAKDWQLPVAGAIDIGNPKLKTMTKADFNKTFKITSCRYFSDYARHKEKVYRNIPKLRRFIDNKVIVFFIRLFK
jgi:hypothetical protein